MRRQHSIRREHGRCSISCPNEAMRSFRFTASDSLAVNLGEITE
jgi:hypothetical protein